MDASNVYLPNGKRKIVPKVEIALHLSFFCHSFEKYHSIEALRLKNTSFSHTTIIIEVGMRKKILCVTAAVLYDKNTTIYRNKTKIDLLSL